MKALISLSKILLACTLFLGALVAIVIVFGESDDTVNALQFLIWKGGAILGLYGIYQIGKRVFPSFFA